MAIYINTKSERPQRVVTDLAEVMGANSAQAVVAQWYQTYNEFVYDEKTGVLIFFKKAYSGYWESEDANLSLLT
jgi:hypothetical protein